MLVIIGGIEFGIPPGDALVPQGHDLLDFVHDPDLLLHAARLHRKVSGSHSGRTWAELTLFCMYWGRFSNTINDVPGVTRPFLLAHGDQFFFVSFEEYLQLVDLFCAQNRRSKLPSTVSAWDISYSFLPRISL